MSDPHATQDRAASTRVFQALGIRTKGEPQNVALERLIRQWNDRIKENEAANRKLRANIAYAQQMMEGE